jgi:hypothetical protein
MTKPVLEYFSYSFNWTIFVLDIRSTHKDIVHLSIVSIKQDVMSLQQISA